MIRVQKTFLSRQQSESVISYFIDLDQFQCGGLKLHYDVGFFSIIRLFLLGFCRELDFAQRSLVEPNISQIKHERYSSGSSITIFS